jgi:arabinoxylan arabinofuranohydrolase
MLDVPNGEDNDGVNIALWENNNLDPQRFKVVEISSGVYGIVTKVSDGTKCLDVYNWDTSDGANICQWTYYGNENQQWKFEKTK